MASNILLKRVCNQCGKGFIAKTTVTKFCSKNCNRQYHRAALQTQKLNKSDIETIVTQANNRIKSVEKDLLSVVETAVMLSCSRATVYKMLAAGRLKSVNFHGKMTRVLKSEILGKFDEPDQPKPIVAREKVKPVPKNPKAKLTIEDCYKMDDLVSMFKKNRTALYTAFARAKVPKLKVGKEAYFSKEVVNKLLKKQEQPPKPGLSREREINQEIASRGLTASQCYTIDECVELFGKDRSLLYGIFNRRMVPKIRAGQNVLLSKKVIDKLYRAFLKDGKI